MPARHAPVLQRDIAFARSADEEGLLAGCSPIEREDQRRRVELAQRERTAQAATRGRRAIPAAAPRAQREVPDDAPRIDNALPVDRVQPVAERLLAQKTAGEGGSQDPCQTVSRRARTHHAPSLAHRRGAVHSPPLAGAIAGKCEATATVAPMNPTVRLTHGALMPQVGLGTWPMSGAEAESAVVAAVQAGYRLFDTAYAYGNEDGVGRGLRACGLPREELFVTTKLNGQWHGYLEAQEAWAQSAQRLAVDYIDLFLIHWPLPGQDRYVDAFRGLARLLEDGKVRAIGASNFKPAHVQRVIEETGIVPDVNQIELNPYTTRPLAREYHAEHGIVTQSWAPIGHGRELLRERAIVEIAQAHKRTPAQVVLRWHVQLGLTVVPKSSRPERMAENIAIFDFTLSDEEIAAISALDQGEDYADDSDVMGHDVAARGFAASAPLADRGGGVRGGALAISACPLEGAANELLPGFVDRHAVDPREKHRDLDEPSNDRVAGKPPIPLPACSAFRQYEIVGFDAEGGRALSRGRAWSDRDSDEPALPAERRFRGFWPDAVRVVAERAVEL